MADRPVLDEVRAWVDAPADELSDADLADILAAETEDQNAWCEFPDEYPAAARIALFRRCSRAVAARPLPLGSLPVPATGVPIEFGTLRLPPKDPEIERLEARWRVIAVA
jgi:hypothetical protein